MPWIEAIFHQMRSVHQVVWISSDWKLFLVNLNIVCVCREQKKTFWDWCVFLWHLWCHFSCLSCNFALADDLKRRSYIHFMKAVFVGACGRIRVANEATVIENWNERGVWTAIIMRHVQLAGARVAFEKWNQEIFLCMLGPRKTYGIISLWVIHHVDLRWWDIKSRT